MKKQQKQQKERKMMTNTEKTQEPTWGHPIQPKALHMIRLLLQNIGQINLTSTGSIKLALIQSFTQAAQVDVCTITKCNVSWTKHQHIYTQQNKQSIGGKRAIGK